MTYRCCLSLAHFGCDLNPHVFTLNRVRTTNSWNYARTEYTHTQLPINACRHKHTTNKTHTHELSLSLSLSLSPRAHAHTHIHTHTPIHTYLHTHIRHTSMRHVRKELGIMRRMLMQTAWKALRTWEDNHYHTKQLKRVSIKHTYTCSTPTHTCAAHTPICTLTRTNTRTHVSCRYAGSWYLGGWTRAFWMPSTLGFTLVKRWRSKYVYSMYYTVMNRAHFSEP